ncbi:winged helix-turn-helix transcriptional regulator [Natrarchaeobius oligotrophus]|uniref:Transcriptional regulator n=1 Tax=Natrarchaeobius chitinivorans TaxID=1679083 RepID=A0A3N6M460_NATCH|nr:helix-turn-helix domain-containing protein [Natrarchaeobius chitinivorans]RQG96767.1 transcriptional regulator [Natrarchaeobius chitinivorans]
MDESRDADAVPGRSCRTDPSCYCQLGGVLELLSRKHAIQVICLVGETGPVRYGEIEDAFGAVSSSTLSARLDELVGAGYLAREQYDEIPPRVEYDLTTTGEQLQQRLQPLLEWAVIHEEFEDAPTET